MFFAIEPAMITAVGGLATGILGISGAVYATYRTSRNDKSKIDYENTQTLFNTQQAHIQMLSTGYADVTKRLGEAEREIYDCHTDKAEQAVVIGKQGIIIEQLQSEVAALRADIKRGN